MEKSQNVGTKSAFTPIKYIIIHQKKKLMKLWNPSSSRVFVVVVH